LGADYEFIHQVKSNFEAADISDKLKSLLVIAGKVQKGGENVTSEDVERARSAGATDKEIHDAVLIAAAFCMFNRYVDGLATWQPQDPQEYREMGELMAKVGYLRTDWDAPAKAASAS
jgi:alkylhydroperoxidase/carboxymuconolactone decarboxylase family protein YurZ